MDDSFKAPWFKFYVERWLVETALMEPQEEGAFARLLAFSWMNVEHPCMLPNDDAELARMSRLGWDAWQKSKGRILKNFLVDDDSEMLYHPAFREQWLEMQESRRRRSSAGSQGGLKKARRCSTADEESMTTEEVEGWAAIREAYPARDGGHGWRDARVGYLVRVREDHAPVSDLVAATERYRDYCVARKLVATTFVMQARRFFGAGENWKEEWNPKPPPDGGSIGSRQRRRLE